MKKILLAVILARLATWQASAIIAYNNPDPINSAGIQSTGGPFLLGNEFQVNQSISVTSIGAFDFNLNGFGGTGVDVAIYSLSGSTWSQVLGTSHNFSGTQPALSYVGSSSFFSITPVTLGLGTYAIVAANYGTTDNPDWNANLNGTPPRATFQTFTTAISMTGTANGSNAFYASGSTLPGTLSGLTFGGFNGGAPTFGAGTFEFSPVPEATEFTIAGVAMLGLVYIGRAYRSKAKLA